MSYKYITDNNLYYKQNYMYAKYEGKQFLEDYLRSRETVKEISEGKEKEDKISKESIVYQDLRCIYSDMKNDSKDAINKINAYVKTFEVRKRLYTEYSEWKPVEGAGFEDYEIYLLFSECLLEAYKKTKCLKYYSCLLKVDDMMLSVHSLLSFKEKEHLSAVIYEELAIFQSLLEEHGIDIGGIG